MLEDVKKSFFQVDNERKLYLGKVCLYLCCYYLDASETILLIFSAVDEKNKAVHQASALEEKMKALEEENAALKLAAAAERPQKDRLLAVMHTLTGMLDSSRNPVIPPFK